MATQMRGQLRLAAKMTKQQVVADRKIALGKKGAPIDLPLSTEMSEWLTSSFDTQADDCTLPETISSSFIQPMNAMAVYCPTAAINATQFSATRISNLSIGSTVPFLPNGTFYSHRSSWKDTFSNTAIIESDEPTKEVFSVTGRTSNNFNESVGISTTNMNNAPNDPISRLNVLWLQRRAQLEREAGDDNAALKTLDEAIAVHLGTDDYLKADLRGDVASSDAVELLNQIDQNYVRYDPRVHVKATIIQRVYRRRIHRKRAAATVMSRHYRGYLARRNLWIRNDLLRQSAAMVQKLVRNHLWRRSKLAAKLQRWYMLWKQVHLYIKMREKHRAAVCIQRYWRGYLCRSRVTIEAIRNKIMTKKIQRAFRGFLTRRRRVVGLILYHKLFYFSARTIQCLARKVQAKARRKLRHRAAESREVERHSREQDFVAALVAEDVHRTKCYVDTTGGRLHLALVMDDIASKDSFMRERSRGKIAAEELHRRQCLLAFQLFNRSGSGRLTAPELDGALSELDLPLAPAQVASLAGHMGLPADTADDTVGIDIVAFTSWYSGEASSSSSSSSSSSRRREGEGGDDTFVQVRDLLRQRLYELEITGELLRIRAQREIARASADLQRKKALCVFRRNTPPRFQCCQCRAAFAVFGAYHSHFPLLGRCVVSGQPALFYRKSPIFWRKQRECEEELVRRSELRAYQESTLTRAWFAELSIVQSSSMRRLIARDVKAFISMEGNEPENMPDAPKMTRKEKGRVFAKKALSMAIDTLAPFNGESQIVQLCAAFLSSSLKSPQPVNWLEDDKNDLSSGDVRDWIEMMLLPVPIGPAAVVVADDDTHADEEAGVGARKRGGNSYMPLLHRQTHRERTVPPNLAAEVVVKLIRVLLSVSTEVLIASGTFHHERPRAIGVSDKELAAKGHQDLTLREYESSRADLLKRIEGLRTKWRELLAASVAKGKGDTSAAVGGAYSASDAADGLVQNLELEDAYMRAHVQTKHWIQSSLGRRHIRHLSDELWVARQRFQADDAAAKNESKTSKTEEKAANVGPFKTTADSRYLFHRLVRSEWVPRKDMARHLFGSSIAGTASTVAAIGSTTLVVIGEGDLDNRATDQPQSTATSESPPAGRVTPALALFELQWLMKAMGLLIPADKLQEVERQLDPQSSGDVTSGALLEWIATRESGGFSSVVQAAANAIATAARTVTGTLYSEHARQVVLMAARRRARLALQYEHQCFAEKAKASEKKAKPSGKQDKKSTAFDSDDDEVFHQGGGVVAQLAALRVGHDTCEVSLVQKAMVEDNEKRRGRGRWWRPDEADVEASATVDALDEFVHAFGGLTRAVLSSAKDPYVPKQGGASALPAPGLVSEGESPGPESELQPLVSSDSAPAPAQSVLGETGVSDPFDILGVPDPADADALLAKAQDTVTYFLVHLFDVSCEQSLSEDEVSALLLVLQRGISERELLRVFPKVRHSRTSLQHMTRYLKEKLCVIPEASVRNTSVLGRVFGIKQAFIARCGTRKAASTIAALALTESIVQKRSSADRYWEAHGKYYRDRADSFFRPKPDDDKVATQLDMGEQEKRPDNDLLMHHRAQLLAMRQVKVFVQSEAGKNVFAAEKDRVAELWRAQCVGANGCSEVGMEAELVEGLIGYAFDVFASGVLPLAVSDDSRGMFVTELPFLMHFCVSRLRLESSPHLGRIFAMALLLVDREDMTFLSQSQVVALLLPAFHPRALPDGFFSRLLDQLSQPSPASITESDATAALMSRARQEAAFHCFQFQYKKKTPMTQSSHLSKNREH